jgi:phenylpropionate dioxygenase-like ring-hydroxylating dioxygenase large terminal subunit
VAHFAPYDLAGRYRAAHVSKIVPCNWKVMAEAFMESHHTGATHPQIAAFLADVNSQYDILSDHVTRQFTAIAVPSPTLSARKLSEMAILQAMGAVSSASEEDADQQHAPTNARDTPKAPTTLQDGQTARMYAAEAMRQALGAEDGFDYAGVSDAEILDALLYNVFPHQSFWAGHAPTLIYRWRPNGLDPESSVMDVVILKRVPKGMARPKPAAEFALSLDQDWTEAAPILGAGLAAVFEQDMENMPAVQAGLRSSGTGVVHFSRYSEMRIRHMHQKIARMIAEGEAQT